MSDSTTGYDESMLSNAAFDGLKRYGWSVKDVERTGPAISFTAVHSVDVPAIGTTTVEIDIEVPEARMPHSWVETMRDEFEDFDAYGLSEYLARETGAEVGDIYPDISTFVGGEEFYNAPEAAAYGIAQAARLVDEAKAPERGLSEHPVKRSVFDDWDYISPDDFRAHYIESVGIDRDIYESPEDIDDDTLYKYMAEMRDLDLNDTFENVKYGILDRPFIITGSLGLWDGRIDVSAVCNDFEDVYRKVMGCDCEMFRAWDENGRLFVEGVHHDGTHSFEARMLNEEGERFIKDAACGYGVTSTDIAIATLDAYSEHPRIAERVFGCKALDWEQKKPTAIADLAAAAASKSVSDQTAATNTKKIV